MPRQDQIKIAAIANGYGGHVSSWRHPAAPVNASQRLEPLLHMARVAEAGKLDAIFLPDSNQLSVRDPETQSRTGRYNVKFEPFTILSAMAAVTSRIGLVATASTTYSNPYTMARLLGSLDLLSGGRAGWNVVTSYVPAEAANYGMTELPPHDVRYARAHEFLDVVRGLFDSFEDDALVLDKAEGLFYDPAKVHELNHKGEHFDVRGPLNQMRPPQGYPVLFQAGGSEQGRELAASNADAVYSGEPTFEKARALYADIKGRMAKYGRSPDQLKMMPGLYTMVGETDEIARAKLDYLNSMAHPGLIRAVVSSALAGLDLDRFDVDDPIPEFEDPAVVHLSQYHIFARMAREERLTIRQMHDRLANGGAAHLAVVGSPATIADYMEEAFETHAADGFSLTPATAPEGLESFVELVVPELQRRGLFRTDYEGTTLRDSLGLARPEHPAALARRTAVPAG